MCPARLHLYIHSACAVLFVVLCLVGVLVPVLCHCQLFTLHEKSPHTTHTYSHVRYKPRYLTPLYLLTTCTPSHPHHLHPLTLLTPSRPHYLHPLTHPTCTPSHVLTTCTPSRPHYLHPLTSSIPAPPHTSSLPAPPDVLTTCTPYMYMYTPVQHPHYLHPCPPYPTFTASHPS